ncbi:MAG: FliI/YscN family ATPase [Treponemataceae bacterium]|nr:FliI/YscN family ATPase [Treponemataceae bacterium]
MENLFEKYVNNIKDVDTIHYTGNVIAVKGNLVESKGPRSVIGEICTIKVANMNYNGAHESEKYIPLLAEVTGLNGTTVQLTCYGDTKGIEVGCEVVGSGSILKVGVGENLLGRVVDALGHPYDQKGEIIPRTYYPAIAPAPNPLTRKPICERVLTGIRSIDGLCAVGKGQRLGIMAGSGVGKSTLMGMIARNTNADINVIALVGERGREVNDFITKDLGEEGLKRSVVVVATSDTPSICRLRAAYTATAIAEYFRDQGKDVMFMMDNMKRFADAQREIALVAGEPAAQRGYTPSVFDLIPKLLERTGTNDKGSITAFYNVLVDGDDMTEPITDKVRGTVDGHIVLSRNLAQMNHYPAIDILNSISRLANDINGEATKKACGEVRKLMAAYENSKDLIDVGAYAKGSNPLIDKAIELHDEIENFLIQDISYNADIAETMKGLSSLSGILIPFEEYTSE